MGRVTEAYIENMEALTSMVSCAAAVGIGEVVLHKLVTDMPMSPGRLVFDLVTGAAGALAGGALAERQVNHPVVFSVL